MAELYGTLGQLQDRLETVLSPEAPATTTSPSVPPTVGSDVHGRLQTLNTGVSVMLDRVLRLMQRVEV